MEKTAFLNGLRNESRDVAVSQLLHYLPLLRPANSDGVRGYIHLLPGYCILIILYCLSIHQSEQIEVTNEWINQFICQSFIVCVIFLVCWPLSWRTILTRDLLLASTLNNIRPKFNNFLRTLLFILLFHLKANGKSISAAVDQSIKIDFFILYSLFLNSTSF